jgi:hypothetical protein
VALQQASQLPVDPGQPPGTQAAQRPKPGARAPQQARVEQRQQPEQEQWAQEQRQFLAERPARADAE